MSMPENSGLARAASSSSCVRPVAMTRACARLNARLVAAPIPETPPVMSAVFPWKSKLKFTLHGSLLAQCRDLRVVVAQVLQNLHGVLARLGRVLQLLRLRIAAQVDRLADDRLLPVFRMVDRLRDAEMLHLRIGEYLVDRVDRAARDAGLLT